MDQKEASLMVDAPINLLFHGVGEPKRSLEPGEERYWVTPRLFLEVLDLAVQRPQVSLSFDDCNRSDVEIVLSALSARGLGATFFPISARLGSPGNVSHDGLREIASAGMVIGTHGRRHIPWRHLSAAAATEEFVTARMELEDVVQQPVSAAACPFGSYGSSTLESLRGLGYTRVYTSDAARSTAHAWLQPRYTITSNQDLLRIRQLVDHGGLGPARHVNRVRLFLKSHRR